MKILLMSDSHLVTGLEKVVTSERADINLHLGDSQLMKNNKSLKCFDYVVRGNCDFEKLPEHQMFELDGKTWLMIHGNQVDNPHDLASVADYAKTFDCQVICFGHIHVPIYAKVNGVTIINPGSFARSRSTYPESYMILEINDGQWQLTLKNARSHQPIKELTINE